MTRYEFRNTILPKLSVADRRTLRAIYKGQSVPEGANLDKLRDLNCLKGDELDTAGYYAIGKVNLPPQS